MPEEASNLTPDGPPNGPQESQKIFIDENEWLESQRELERLRGYKQALDEVELRLGQKHPEVQRPQPPPQPEPEFQYHSDEELQKALDEGDLKSYHKMSKHNTKTELAEELYKLEKTKITPLQQTGVTAISELSGTVAQTSMPHLDIPEVKKTYQERLQQLTGSGQVATAEVHKNVYEWAVGTHIDKIQSKIQDGLLRQQAEAAVNTPTDQTGRKASQDQVKVPTVHEFFEPVAIEKLQQKYPGTSPEQAADMEFKRHGGFDGWYKKFYGPKPKKEENT